MMNLFIVVVVTAILGVASSTMVCLRVSVLGCIKKLTQDYKQHPVCVAYSELMECIRIEAIKCNVESDPLVKDVINGFNDTCTRGTEMNELLNKHKACALEADSPEDAECYDPIFKEIRDIGITREKIGYQIKIQKVGCKHRATVNQCILNNVNRSCGPEAYDFKKRYDKHLREMSTRFCREIEDMEPDPDFKVTQTNNELHTTVQPQVTNWYPAYSNHTSSSATNANDLQTFVYIFTAIILLAYSL